MMFKSLKYDYVFIGVMWSISIIMAIFFHHVRHDDELKKLIQLNIMLIPQFQLLSYSTYLGVFLCVFIYNMLAKRKTAVKQSITKSDLFKHGSHAVITLMTAYVDLIMFTILALTFFNVAYDVGNETAISIIHTSDIFYIFIFPPLILWTTYRLKKK